MPNYTITFTPAPGSYGTLIEYKDVATGTWVTPSTAVNPTSLTSYTLFLTSGHTYYIGVTSIGLSCTRRRNIIGPIIVDSDNCCPAGYIISVDGSYCYKIEEVASTPPTGAENAVAVHFKAYSTCGSYIYNSGYAINGTGASTQISLSNNFWKNGTGLCADNNLVPQGTTEGPLNRTGLWSSTAQDNQDIGFSVCINVAQTKTYYIGIACDNYAIVNVDGTNIITQDSTALGVQYGVGDSATFKVWHIYPITLLAGSRVIELIGHNVNSVAALGAEIYNASALQISTASSYTDLGSRLIFSTKDYVGQPIQLGTGGAGYTCPATYSLVACTAPYICRRVTTTAIISC